MLNMKCNNAGIKLNMDEEKLSMLITGRSRMGKTYFASLLGASLMQQKNYVHLIDLGTKWSAEDKKRLQNEGAVSRCLAKEATKLAFMDEKDLISCGYYIANAMGFQSENATSVLKKLIKDLIKSNPTHFSFSDLIEGLTSVSINEEWANNVKQRFESFGDVPDLYFQVNPNQATAFVHQSTLWDLSGLDEVYVKVVATLIVHSILSYKKNQFYNEMNSKKIFVVIDEFQNLDCNRKSIIGICLTEGQKYKMYVVLITQFLVGQYSDAVVNQFNQGGIRVHFCLTDSDAVLVSKQLATDKRLFKIIHTRLTNLARGECLIIGSHTLNNDNAVYEVPRFVKVYNEVN